MGGRGDRERAGAGVGDRGLERAPLERRAGPRRSRVGPLTVFAPAPTAASTIAAGLRDRLRRDRDRVARGEVEDLRAVVVRVRRERDLGGLDVGGRDARAPSSRRSAVHPARVRASGRPSRSGRSTETPKVNCASFGHGRHDPRPLHGDRAGGRRRGRRAGRRGEQRGDARGSEDPHGHLRRLYAAGAGPASQVRPVFRLRSFG